MILRTAQRLLAFFARFCIGARQFGLPGAVRVFLLGRFTRGDAVTSVPLKPLGRRFWYRARSDAGVLCQFYTQGFRIADCYGPHRVTTIIDAGANIGDSTLRLRRFHPQARMLAIEADEGNFALLQRNVAHDPLTTPLLRGLWNREGTLNVRATWANVAFRVSEAAPAGESRAIPACTVPGLMQEFGIETLDLLKLDIEGAEAVVFQTEDLSWLQRVRCIVFECCDADDPGTTMAIFRRLTEAGVAFNCHLCGENLVLIRDGLTWFMCPDLWLDAQPAILPHLVEEMRKTGVARNDSAVQDSK